MDYDYCGKKYYLRRVDRLEIHVRRRDPEIGFPDGCSVAAIRPSVRTVVGGFPVAIQWDASFGTLTKEEILFIYDRLHLEGCARYWSHEDDSVQQRCDCKS